jgi:hypothetical protein
MEFFNERFEGVTVPLDGNAYTDCVFRDVLFVYGGGDLDMTNCDIDRFRFQFEGQLANGLHAIYQLFGTEGLMKIIRGFVEPSSEPVEI